MSTETDARQKAAAQSTLTVAAVRFLADWCRDIDGDLTIKSKTVEYVAEMVKDDDPGDCGSHRCAVLHLDRAAVPGGSWSGRAKAFAERHPPGTVFKFDDEDRAL